MCYKGKVCPELLDILTSIGLDEIDTRFFTKDIFFMKRSSEVIVQQNIEEVSHQNMYRARFFKLYI